jgi:hypothetical protein
VFFVFF